MKNDAIVILKSDLDKVLDKIIKQVYYINEGILNLPLKEKIRILKRNKDSIESLEIIERLQSNLYNDQFKNTVINVERHELKKIYEIMKENWYEINNNFFKLHAVNVEEERKTEGELILPELSMLKSYLKGSKMINESQDYSAKPVIDEFRGESEDIVVDPEREFEKEFEEDIKKFEDPEREFEKEFEEDIKKFEDPEREFEKEFEEDIKKFEDVPSPITGLIPDESFLKLLLLNGLQGEINRLSTSSNYLPRDILQKNILWFLYNLSTEVGYDNPTGQFSFTIMGVKFKFNYSVKCTSDQLTLA